MNSIFETSIFFTQNKTTMNNRVLVGALIGTIAFFLLGMVLYGFLLGDTIDSHTMDGVGRADDEMQIAFIILGNLLAGLLFAYILDKANANSVASGATIGAVMSFLCALSTNFTMYGVTNVWKDLGGVVIDAIVYAVIGAIVGAAIGWYYGRGRRVVVA